MDMATDDSPSIGRGDDFQERFPEQGIVFDDNDAARGRLHELISG